MIENFRTFDAARLAFTARFKTRAVKVQTERWQGQKVDRRPDMISYELLNEAFQVNLFGIERLEHWADDIQPNLPWADDHFEERVCGVPLNPGIQWENWPWASSADKHRNDTMFNHTYMERLWPRYAGRTGPLKSVNDFTPAMRNQDPAWGIRGEYGDLSTLVDKLSWEPHTRQAYIPLYFPEDTGLEGRMPCTLGYQFIVRDNKLHLYYPLRSCDFIRHWADDCYLAVRLLLWMLDECRKNNPTFWNEVTPGTYTMHMTSFHVFTNDWLQLTGRKG